MTTNNPAAFPSQLHEAREPGDHDPETGMTLRDWFAGQALAGLMACKTGPDSAESWASVCYVLADAMLAERAKGGDA